MNKERFMIRNRENGCRLTECSTYKEAYLQLLAWEEEDKEDGTYEENFYEIYDLEKEEIVY
jgi:hypothetical protein